MKRSSGPLLSKAILEELYKEFNRREQVSPDPLQFLWKYDDQRDREIVGLVSSCLAYGRVAQILKSVALVLEKMPGPFEFIQRSTLSKLKMTFKDFRHRFTTGEDMAAMLYGVKLAIEEYGSLHSCFLAGFDENDETVIPALQVFVGNLGFGEEGSMSYLLPLPSRGSACKRLNLFLRWMVRRDDVDPGGWVGIQASKLVAPLDIHMFTICRSLGITQRKQADMKTALEITDFFRTIEPEDPVKYDFALTRLGILDDTDLPSFLKKRQAQMVA